MKNCKFLLVITGLLFFASCTKETHHVEKSIVSPKNKIIWTDAESQVLFQMRGKNNKVSMEEVNLLANDAIRLLDGNKPVKSGTSRRIATIKPLSLAKKQSTSFRSSSGEEETLSIPDTLAYLINFADSAGFTIIAADTRVETPILAMAYSGTLGTETNYPGIGVFLEGTEHYLIRSITEAEQLKDSLMSDIVAKLYYAHSDSTSTKALSPGEYTIISSELLDAGPWSPYYTKGPLLPVEWGQGNEYNEAFWNNVKNKKSCSTCPAGCVAVATAQIMSYWQYPTVIGNSTFNWSLLIQYTGAGTPDLNKWTYNKNNVPQSLSNQIADLMEKIGAAVGMSYGCNESSADSDDAIKFLKNKGYTGGSKKDYDYKSVTSSLINNCPVYAYGYTTDNTFLGIHVSYSGGHAWVIDGYRELARNVTLIVTYSGTPPNTPPTKANTTTWTEIVYTKQYANHIHNNWGWAGDYNAWFVSGCFDSHTSVNSQDHSANFKYNNKIYVDLKH